MQTEILQQFHLTKADRVSFAENIIQQIDDGEIDPLKVHIQLKCIEDIIKQITSNENYKKALLDAAAIYPGKSFEFMGAKVEKKEVGTKYDYSQCNDMFYSKVTDDLTSLTEQVKQRQTFLQTVPQSGLLITDPETGESYTVYPPSKSSTSSVAVTLK